MDAILPGMKKPGGERYPLQGFEISLEIYLILSQSPQVVFSVADLQKHLRTIHGEKIRLKRIRQICEALEKRGRIQAINRKHPKTNQEINTYMIYNGSGELLEGSEFWKVVQAFKQYIRTYE